VFFLSTNAKNCNVMAAWRAHKRGAFMANPCYTQIHPTCIPRQGEFQSKLTLMSESLRNDGRVWVPKKAGDDRAPAQIPESERDYYLERRYPAFGNLVPRDLASRNAKTMIDEGRGVGPTKEAVYLDFRDAIQRDGRDTIEARYGNLFDIYHEITDENAYDAPMRIYPAPHYTMGGLWVDYNLMTTIPGLFALGECNFSDHGANRLGASALMQGLADGYFIIPATMGGYLGDPAVRKTLESSTIDTNDAVFADAEKNVGDRLDRLLSVKGKRTVDSFHRELGRMMWDKCGMSRNADGLGELLTGIPKLREEFWSNVNVTGSTGTMNQTLERAARVADYLEFAEVMALDALDRKESCGGHFREESATEEGEARRDDENFRHVAAWAFNGVDEKPTLHKEPLEFKYVKLTQRSYK
ncbi:MAG: succinate dehydrogenase (quinone) flavoprotein subunit, partial [Myxococcota bacterium]